MPTSNPNPTTGSADTADNVEIVAVAASTLTLRADPRAVLDYIIDAATGAAHPKTTLSIVALPPLWAYFAASGGHGLDEAYRAVRELRPARLLAALFTYGHAPFKRALPWLALHRGQMEFLLRVEHAARDSGLTFLGPTGLMGHPRTHWEGWADSPHAFHYAWSFQPEQPRTWARQPAPPTWLRRRGISSSRRESSGGLSLVRPAGPRPVDVGWGGDLTAGSDLVWWPRIGGRGEPRLLQVLQQPGAWHTAVISALDAPAAIATRDASGTVTLNALTPPPEPEVIGPDGGAVRIARWRGSVT